MKVNKLFVLSIAALILTGCSKNNESSSGSEKGEETTEEEKEEVFDEITAENYGHLASELPGEPLKFAKVSGTIVEPPPSSATKSFSDFCLEWEYGQYTTTRVDTNHLQELLTYTHPAVHSSAEVSNQKYYASDKHLKATYTIESTRCNYEEIYNLDGWVTKYKISAISGQVPLNNEVEFNVEYKNTWPSDKVHVLFDLENLNYGPVAPSLAEIDDDLFEGTYNVGTSFETALHDLGTLSPKVATKYISGWQNVESSGLISKDLSTYPILADHEFVSQGKFLIGLTEEEEGRTLSFKFTFANEEDKRATIVWGDGTSTEYTASDLSGSWINASHTYAMPDGATADTKFDFTILGEIDDLMRGDSGYGYQYIESLQFAKSVTSIREEAFMNADHLVSVSGQNVTQIQARAFSRANALASAAFPNATLIGMYAFFETALTSFVVPSSVETIGNGAFGASLLQTVTFLARDEEDPYYYIYQEAFRECENLTSVTFADKLMSIGARAFYDDTALASLNIPASCEIVNQFAFGNMAADAEVFVNWPNYSKPSDWNASCNQGETRNATLVRKVLNRVYAAENVGGGSSMGSDCEDFTGAYAFVIDASAHKGEKLTFRYNAGPLYNDSDMIEARFTNYNDSVSTNMNASPKEINVELSADAEDEECFFYFFFTSSAAKDFAFSIAYSPIE